MFYALPMEQEPLAIYYSEKVWEDAHLSEGDIPKTWDAMLELAAKLETKDRAGLVFEPGQGYFQNFTWYPWMWQGGADAVGGDGKSAFDTKGAIQALQLFQDGVVKGVSPRTNPAAGDLPAALDKGQAAMWQSGIWNVADFRLRLPKTRYGIFRLPTPSGGRYATIAGGWAFVANKNGRNPEAAAKFCVEAVGSMDPASVKRVADWCTVAKSDISPRKSALDLGTARGGYSTPIMKQFKDDIYPGTRGEPRYPPVIYKAISDAIQNTMLAGHKAADEAEIAGASIDAYLKSYEGAKIL
ncbi:extracellular solute-binding protein [Fodinicola feengrottensis]|uniref:extracellular solute-binding protein n=1 Tax=Fodinicola feengrottensis TaxID=435914 RepID=UPI002442639B|nr:extracellular solute-binding protein [Fodinicola feengrottensis]